MPRLRGAAVTLPEGEHAWALLNDQVYGTNTRGGYHERPDPELISNWSWSGVFNREAPLLLVRNLHFLLALG